MNEPKEYLQSLKKLFDSVKQCPPINNINGLNSVESSNNELNFVNPPKSAIAETNQKPRQFIRSSIDVNQLFHIASNSECNTNQNCLGNRYNLQDIESVNVEKPSCLANPKDPSSFEDFGDLFIDSLQSPMELYREPNNKHVMHCLNSIQYEMNRLQLPQHSINSTNNSPTFDCSNHSTQSNHLSSFNLAENMNVNFNSLNSTPFNGHLNERNYSSTMINNINRCSTPINDTGIGYNFSSNSHSLGSNFENYFQFQKQSTIDNETQFYRHGTSQDFSMQSNNTKSNNNDFLACVELSKNDFNGQYAKDIIDKAKTHRTAAQFETKAVEWRGNFVNDQHRAIVYSVKVFFGGIPWDITEEFLQSYLIKYGKIKIEWPGKDVKCTFGNTPAKCGYLYVIFENPNFVASLLKDCTCEIVDGFFKYYFTIKTRRTQFKKIQVIPWIIADSNWVRNTSYRLDPSKTIFVGNLHGLTTASNLATIMNSKFENVLYVGIDTDKKNYPSGSARCTFGTDESYLRAISAGFVNVISNKFNKKLQIDPYLSNSNCSICTFSSGVLFCRDLRCFKYFCVNCLHKYHETAGHVANPIMRNKKGQQIEF